LYYYKNLEIISGIPLKEIKKYIEDLGGKEKSKLIYEYQNMEIKITIEENDISAILGIPRHIINIKGDRTLAEKFLNDFRLRFLSAGG